MRVILMMTALTTVTADTTFTWKMVKANQHDRLTTYGLVSVCGIARGVEPLYPGELRQHNCDLIQCRKTVQGLEEWICEGCVRGTPQCLEFERKKLARQSDSRARRSHERSIERSRKIRYRRMKRAAILAERKKKRAERLAEKKAKKEAREARKLKKEQKKQRRMIKAKSAQS